MVFVFCLFQLLKAVNLATNPSFESANSSSNTHPSGWFFDSTSSSFWSLDTSTFQAGTKSLKYTDWDADKSPMTYQNLTGKIYPGVRYTVKAYIKTSGITGGAEVGFCWVEKGHTKWFGGYHIGFVKNTEDWKLYSGTSVPVPDGYDYQVRLVIKNGDAEGVAWFDAITVEPYTDFLKRIEVHKYRQEVANEKVDLISQIDLEGTRFSLSDFTMTVKLKDATGTVQYTTTQIKKGDGDDIYYHTELDCTKLSVGWYTVEATLENGFLKSSQTAKTEFHRIEYQPKRNSFIDEYNRMIVNGEPIFPIGSALDNMFEEDVNIYLQDDAPFNFALIYVRQTDEKLEQIKQWSNGRIKVMQNVINEYGITCKDKDGNDVSTHAGVNSCASCSISSQNLANNTNWLAGVVNAQKDNDMIFNWYINEETCKYVADILKTYTRKIREIDPNHPIYTMLKEPWVTDYSRPSFDVVGSDPFPIPTYAIEITEDWAAYDRNETLDARGHWLATQTSPWTCYGGSGGMPSYEQMKNMAWTGIVSGAKGLLFVQYRCLKIKNLLKEWWPQVVKFSKEIYNLRHIILSIDTPPTYKLPYDKYVKARKWRDGDTTYLLIVSMKSEMAGFKFTVSDDVLVKKTKALLGDSKIERDGYDFTIKMEPLGVLMIRFGDAANMYALFLALFIVALV
ncbi:hypothetical protein EIN_410570 [Entamoeba invadens IP1]|uniref:CBM-cenC domain-containing protein n=1 Tax=Entamoeba invadens IP1 TaxID=370355 RepID=A0A0A1U6X8_ENTIV|nr:hypothetical protein EIN_410570 [Entamoeba invadens IP1]ELP87724.1 hypothetical protein EIN_410570 [Entamoeba invadens IP1]|eukprot:XP_004254495.1 hypothetical protein EIN_410570 [Entamoeba invadens IP1]